MCCQAPWHVCNSSSSQCVARYLTVSTPKCGHRAMLNSKRPRALSAGGTPNAIATRHGALWLALSISVGAFSGCSNVSSDGGLPEDEAYSATPATSSTNALTPPALSASVAGCPARVNDSGAVIYLVVATDCEPRETSQVLIQVLPPRAAAATVPFPGFGVAQNASIPIVGAREITVFKAEHWYETPYSNSWQPRDGAGLLVLNGYVYLLGGWLYGPVTNEVWRTRNMRDWEFLGHAPWEGRHGAAWVVHNHRLFVIGGDLLDDVWSSADGIDWRAEAIHAPFGGRYTPNAVSLDGKLLVYAGQTWNEGAWCTPGGSRCEPRGFSDVWQSSDDGRTWTQLIGAAPWAGRGLVHGSIVHGGRIFLIGGGLKAIPPGEQWSETFVEFSDAWSSPDGAHWDRELAQLPFPPRTHFSVAATTFGCFVSDGSIGQQVRVSNNLYFASDCRNFVAIPDPPLPARHASSVVEFNGTLAILGGPATAQPSPGTSVWQYVPRPQGI